MDASKMVELAASWKSLPQQHICQTVIMNPSIQIPDTVGRPATVTMTTDGCLGTLNSVRYLEHVQCKISLRYYPRGNVMIALTSPSGTRSILLFPRPRDNFATTFEDWPFLSVHFWGENPVGQWKLEVINMGQERPKRSNRGLLRKWQLIFYGTDENPVRVPRNVGGFRSGKQSSEFATHQSSRPSSSHFADAFTFPAPNFNFPSFFSFKRFKRWVDGGDEDEEKERQVSLMDVSL